MSIDQKFPKLACWSQQKCPLCGEDKILITHGITKGKENEMQFYPDRGYSFCNCKNIWFTEWNNIDLRKRHENNSVDVLRYCICADLIHNRGYKKNKFYCVGLGFDDDPVKNEAKRLGFDTDSHELANIIWCYHNLEHRERPLEELESYYEDLEDKGILFLAMPDPYCIDMENPYNWNHWLLREHHIMWDMDSLCDELEKIGFKILHKIRNTKVKLNKDYYIICQK